MSRVLIPVMVVRFDLGLPKFVACIKKSIIMSRIEELEKELEKERSKEVFAELFSPGVLFCESSLIKVNNREDIKGAIKGVKKTKERYGATPFGFRFVDGNSKVLSGMYYVTGRIFRRDDVPDTKENSIIRCNMISRPVCIENNNSYRYTGEFAKEDVLIDWDGNIIDKGDNYEKYRKSVKSSF